MALIEWQDRFRIGIPSVDYEHQEMIALLNELHARLESEPDRGVVMDFLGEVYARISAHFALEERVMKRQAYDQYPEHKAEHEELLDQIRDIMDDYDADAYFDYEGALAQHLHDWFTKHFSSHDARLHKMLG